MKNFGSFGSFGKQVNIRKQMNEELNKMIQDGLNEGIPPQDIGKNFIDKYQGNEQAKRIVELQMG